LLLPRGSYTARFTYLSYVGYAFGYVPGRAAGDDLRESADVWEGRLDAEPLAFSVAGALEVASEPWPGVRLTDGATDEPWPHMAGDIAFLKRELNHRDLWICVRALEALNKLTGQSLVFDFRIPSERKRAIEAFAATQ
jgi:hypothetical protein